MEVVRHWRPPSGRLERRLFEPRLTHVPFSYLSLRTGHDDLAHALYLTDALAAVRWRERTGRPVVWSYMGLPTRADLVGRRHRIRTLTRVRDAADAVVALSGAAAAALERQLGVRARVIPPGVDLAAFTPGGERAAEPTIFCAAAIGEPRKNAGLLVEAFRRVRRERPGARLLLSRPHGPSPVPEGDGVELVDVDDRAALARAYREAWVSALPSTAEAFGLVLLEAMACGTPGVGVRDGALPEVVDRPEVGTLAEPGDVDSLARALLEGLDLARAPGTAAACRARAEELSTDRCAAAYDALYRELA